MKKIFNAIIDSYIDTKVGITENFLNEKLALDLKANLLALYAGNELTQAGTGNKSGLVHNKNNRSDIIYWLDRAHNNASENVFFDLMDAFVLHLNETCYTGITSYEFHYTLYEKGSFYTKHMDQFRNSDSRQFSMIMYLNADWKKEDGGELSIHHKDRLQNISPTNGKSVFFKSNELLHEVLCTNVPRLSITGWLKK